MTVLGRGERLAIRDWRFVRTVLGRGRVMGVMAGPA
jgi:hypothetical protein